MIENQKLKDLQEKSNEIKKSERLLLSKFHLIDEDFIYVCFEYGMGEYEGNLFVEDLISHLRKSLK